MNTGSQNNEKKKKNEYGWNILYPEEKDRYPHYRVRRIRKTEDDLRELNKLLKKINRQSGRKPDGEKSSSGKRRRLKNASAGHTGSGKTTPEERQQCMVKMYYGNS
ncbi:MAG: hypothetical protein J6Y93_07060, partial [Treponema sp.]|nr:hypothetical protein [Treponema sp.]